MPVWPECKTILGEWSWKQASRWMLASLKPIQPLLKIERCSARSSIAFRFSFSARSFAISSRLRETFSCSRIDSSAIISVVSMRRVAVFPFCGIRFFTPRRLVVIFCPTTDSSVIFDFGVGSGLIITRSASKALMAESPRASFNASFVTICGTICGSSSATLLSSGPGRPASARICTGVCIASASTSRAIDFKSRLPHRETFPLRARLFYIQRLRCGLGSSSENNYPWKMTRGRAVSLYRYV